MSGGYAENRYRRTWFPDEQVAPARVLEALQARRLLAVTRDDVIPWMSAVDIGLDLGLMALHRWLWPLEPLPPADLVPDPTVCQRSLRRGLCWRHPVAQRDVNAALRHYESHGQVIRLPHPLATWGVYLAPLDEADSRTMRKTWAAMDEARESARHEQRLHRLAAGRRAGGLT